VDRRLLTLPGLLLLLSTGCQGESDDDPEAGPVAPSTSATAPATPTPTQGPPLLDAAALPTGAPPRLAYAFAKHPTFGGGDWRLVRPDGSTQPFGPFPALFAVYDDRVVNGYGTEGGFVVQLLAGDGSPVAELPKLGHFALVTTPHRDRVAWLDNGDNLVTVSTDGSVDTRRVRLPHGSRDDQDPVALNGPTLYVDGRKSAPMAISGPGEPVPLPAYSDLVDVSAGGNLAGRLADDPHCWGLLWKGAELRWRTCADRLVSFAPDGRHVLGTVGTVDYRSIVVHGLRTGRVEAQWTNAPRQWVTQVEWEDAAHLLVVVHNPAVGWSVVRLGVDGTAEYAVSPVRTGGAEFAPFRLQLS
jgi:hypothetical protein